MRNLLVQKRFFSLRTKIIASCILAIIITLFSVDHQFVRPVKNFIILIGAIDSQYSIVGLTDIRSIDHVIGDKDSDVILLEYSDYGCVLCAHMQDVFKRLIDDKKIQVVSRHFYKNYEGKYFRHAVAAECVARHVDEDAYRSYSDWLYKNQFTIDGDDELLKQAILSGITTEQFSRCLDQDKDIRNRIQNDSEEGLRLGARGTPYIVVVYKNKPIGISYANQYRAFLDRIELLVVQSQI